MDEQTIKAIEAIIAKGDCAEVRPTKDGITVLHVQRKVVEKEYHTKTK